MKNRTKQEIEKFIEETWTDADDEDNSFNEFMKQVEKEFHFKLPMCVDGKHSLCVRKVTDYYRDKRVVECHCVCHFEPAIKPITTYGKLMRY